jgi:hypothetical protein
MFHGVDQDNDEENESEDYGNGLEESDDRDEEF